MKLPCSIVELKRDSHFQLFEPALPESVNPRVLYTEANASHDGNGVNEIIMDVRLAWLPCS